MRHTHTITSHSAVGATGKRADGYAEFDGRLGTLAGAIAAAPQRPFARLQHTGNIHRQRAIGCLRGMHTPDEEPARQSPEKMT